MTAVQITEYTYTATRKYHDFDQSAEQGQVPECYGTLQDFLDDIKQGLAETGITVQTFKYTAQKQLIEVKRVTGTVPVGKYSILASTYIPKTTDKAAGRSDIISKAIIERPCECIDEEWIDDASLDDEGFTTANPVNSTKNNLTAEGADGTFKSSGTALAATGKIKVDNSYSKLTFDKNVALADAQAAAAATDTQMNNYDIFTQEA